jgi:uncharacterized protein YcfL
MMKRLAATSLALLLLAGCESYGPEELDRLTKEDPNFKQMIAQRDQMQSQIRLIKADLLAKKKSADARVTATRFEYDTYAKTQNDKLSKFRSAIEVNRDALRREIETAEAQLKAKQTELEKCQSTLADMRKVLHESKVINLSAQEKAKWEERILMQSEKVRPLTDDIAELQARIRLNKRKISFLR